MNYESAYSILDYLSRYFIKIYVNIYFNLSGTYFTELAAIEKRQLVISYFQIAAVEGIVHVCISANFLLDS